VTRDEKEGTQRAFKNPHHPSPTNHHSTPFLAHFRTRLSPAREKMDHLTRKTPFPPDFPGPPSRKRAKTTPPMLHSRPPMLHSNPPTLHSRPPMQHSSPPMLHWCPPTEHSRPPMLHRCPPMEHSRPPNLLWRRGTPLARRRGGGQWRCSFGHGERARSVGYAPSPTTPNRGLAACEPDHGLWLALRRDTRENLRTATPTAGGNRLCFAWRTHEANSSYRSTWNTPQTGMKQCHETTSPLKSSARTSTPSVPTPCRASTREVIPLLKEVQTS
jgi:hypothetical protein